MELGGRGTLQKALVLPSRDPSSISDYAVVSRVISGKAPLSFWTSKYGPDMIKGKGIAYGKFSISCVWEAPESGII